MKKTFKVFFLFNFVFLFGQNEIAKKVIELEKNRTSFKSFFVFDISQEIQNNAVGDEVANATFTKVKSSVVNDIFTKKCDYVEFSIPYDGKIVVVDLYQVSISAEGFQIDADKQKNIAYKPGIYYRGIVKGDTTSIACFNFFKDELNGVVSNDELANLVIGKLVKPDNISDNIIYSEAAMKVPSNFDCSFKDDEFTIEVPVSFNRNVLSSKCITTYFEIDYDLFTSNNSNALDTTNWMTSVFNNVQTLYSNDAVTVSLKSLFIWTTQDSYEGLGTISKDYLDKFNEIRPIFNGDVGQLLGIDSGGLGCIAERLNGLCSQNNLSYSDVVYSFLSVPTYSWTISVITHEFGHLFGSRHTHSCVWNGNNTAIDNCASAAQGSSASGYSCRTTPLTIPSNFIKGSIMGYCHLLSDVGIKFSNGFGSQPKAAILAVINASTCLSSDCSNTRINLISSININKHQ